jgi:predicted aminopeptidase
MADTVRSFQMDERQKLFETLRKIEALYAGAATPGERNAAASARERIRRKFEQLTQQERSEEYRFSM